MHLSLDIASIPFYSFGMKANMGILIRLKPNATQRQSLERHFGSNRWLWNHFLDKRRTEYQESKKGSTYLKDAAALTKLKHDGGHDWLNEVSVASLQRTLKHLDDAYKRFFKGKARFPNFKSKKSEQSYTLAGGIRIDGKRLIIPKFQEGLKFNRSLPDIDKINNVTIRRVASGKYYACLSVEAERSGLTTTRREIGIDMGLTDFAVFSDRKRIKAPKLFRKQQAALKRAQQHLSRKKKGSKRREIQKLKVARIHERIANARKDFLHKASSDVIRHYDTICVESLAVRNMMRNRSLAKSIADASWSRFLELLGYKAEWYGRKLVNVGRFYPSSKTCGECGFIHQGLRLIDREWTCPKCGAKLDRDVNAAGNILREGKRELGAAIPENRRGESARPKRTRSAKAALGETPNLPEAIHASRG